MCLWFTSKQLIPFLLLSHHCLEEAQEAIEVEGKECAPAGWLAGKWLASSYQLAALSFCHRVSIDRWWPPPRTAWPLNVSVAEWSNQQQQQQWQSHCSLTTINSLSNALYPLIQYYHHSNSPLVSLSLSFSLSFTRSPAYAHRLNWNKKTAFSERPKSLAFLFLNVIDSIKGSKTRLLLADQGGSWPPPAVQFIRISSISRNNSLSRQRHKDRNQQIAWKEIEKIQEFNYTFLIFY